MSQTRKGIHFWGKSLWSSKTCGNVRMFQLVVAWMNHWDTSKLQSRVFSLVIAISHQRRRFRFISQNISGRPQAPVDVASSVRRGREAGAEGADRRVQKGRGDVLLRNLAGSRHDILVKEGHDRAEGETGPGKENELASRGGLELGLISNNCINSKCSNASNDCSSLPRENAHLLSMWTDKLHPMCQLAVN